MSGFTALNSSSPKVATKAAVTASSPAAINGTADEQPKASSAAPAPAPTPAAAETAPPPASEQTPTDAPVAVDVPTPVDSPASAQESVEAAAAASGSIEVAVDVPAEAQPAVESSGPHSPTQTENVPTQGSKRNQSTAAQADAEASNKRKRSRSNEGRSQLPNHAPKRTQQSPPRRTRARTPDSTVTVTPQNGDSSHAESQSKDKEVWYAQSEPDLNQPPETPQTPHHHAGAAQASADQQLVQRQPQQQQQVDYVPITPQADSRAVVQYQQASYSEPRPTNAVVQLDPKKRKRNFSNRTKTGCLTCRRRKKKCDEAKPECKPQTIIPCPSYSATAAI
ncbi:hypothetical protein NQ176_g6342 [Zarea fungicola]|uniref:Uncharacterized protein n=1 Tax=Zarea fungicola TaxID=93591 RepID=A0ACC1N3Q1_9HYPO|nr:hypothetical protein NQ176_g6342 [Lecanicillium fungicola]